MLMAVMLARQRRVATAAAATGSDGSTPLAAGLTALPSGLLEMIADAVATLWRTDVQAIVRTADGTAEVEADRSPVAPLGGSSIGCAVQ